MGRILGFENPIGPDGFFGRLSNAFGWRYVALCASIYGLNQGMGRGYGVIGYSYWFEGDLQIAPADRTAIYGLANIPWQIKSFFGIAADAFPIRNMHRTYYLLMASFMGVIGWGTMAFLPWKTVDEGGDPFQISHDLLIFLLFLTNVSVAMPDVMIDASVAEKCQQYPQFGVDLQSLLWGSISAFAIVTSLTSGWIQQELGSQACFKFAMVFPLIGCFLPVFLGWLGEKPDKEGPLARKKFFAAMKNGISPPCLDKKAIKDQDFEEFKAGDEKVNGAPIANGLATGMSEYEVSKLSGRVYVLASILAIFAIVVGLVIKNVEAYEITLAVYFSSFIFICTSIFFYLRTISWDLAISCLFIFIKGAVLPGGLPAGQWFKYFTFNCCESGLIRDQEAWLKKNGTAEGAADLVENNSTYPVWEYQAGGKHDHCMANTENPGANIQNYGRPCFSAPLLSSIDTVGNFVAVIGVILYNRYLSHMSYRKIWTITQLLQFTFSFIGIMQYYRWNIMVGIPDWVILVADDEIMQEIFYKLESMPMFILAAKLCPKGIEGTLFAMIMGLSNFGSTMGRSYLGSAMVTAWGGIEPPEFQGMGSYWLMAILCKLIVIASIPFLVPQGTPQDPSPYYVAEEEEEDEKAGQELLIQSRYSLSSITKGKDAMN